MQSKQKTENAELIIETITWVTVLIVFLFS